MRHKEGDAALAQLDTANLAQLVFGLLAGDSVYGKATLGVVDEAEVLAGLLDADDVLEAGRICRIGADLWANNKLAGSYRRCAQNRARLIPCRRP